MTESVEPLVKARVLGERKTARVFPAYIEIAKTWGATKTIAMRQVQGVDLNHDRHLKKQSSFLVFV